MTRSDHDQGDRRELRLQELDFVYMPSRDVAADLTHFEEVLGGRVVFAVDAMGTRVAMIELADAGPRIMLADHLEGEQPVLVYRVESLPNTLAALGGRGWQAETTLEIPYGPCASFRAPGGQRVAVYERTRPDVEAHFAGRREF